MKSRHKKLMIIVLALAGLVGITALVLNALSGNIALFVTPSEVAAGKAPKSRAFRIGGLVEKGSLKREGDGLTVHFVVTDTAKSMNVLYKGVLPDLFKEGKGVVAEGKLGADGLFTATMVLAKHDENYMPPEAASAIEKAQRAKTLAK